MITMNFRKIFLLIIPIAFLIIGLNFHRTKFSNDPEYAYLLNGLNTATFRAVGSTENPGTTVQIYCALALRISHLLETDHSDDLVTAVLKNPDYYINLERSGLIVINALIVLLLGIVVFKYTKRLWFSLLLQIAPLLSSTTLEHVWTKVSPESLLLIAVNIFIILIVRFYYDQDQENKRYPWFFAAICGFGIATKLTFLPLIVIPAFILPLKKQKKTFVFALIPMFILFSINAITQYPHMAKWFFGLSVHTGVYGAGKIGIIDPAQFVNDFVLIFITNISLSVSLLIGLVSILFLMFKKPLKQWLKEHPSSVFLFSVITAQLIGIFMVAKHYHSNHYLIPVISLAGINLVFVLLTLESMIRDKYLKIFRNIQALLVLLIVCLSLMNIPYLKAADKGYKITNKEYDLLQENLDTNYKGYIRTYYYPTSINPYSAFTWGNVYSRNVHVKKLEELYPDAVIFDARTKSFSIWGDSISIDALMQRFRLNRILIIGGPMNKEEIKKMKDQGFVLNEKYYGRWQAVFEIDSSSIVKMTGRD